MRQQTRRPWRRRQHRPAAERSVGRRGRQRRGLHRRGPVPLALRSAAVAVTRGVGCVCVCAWSCLLSICHTLSRVRLFGWFACRCLRVSAAGCVRGAAGDAGSGCGAHTAGLPVLCWMAGGSGRARAAGHHCSLLQPLRAAGCASSRPAPSPHRAAAAVAAAVVAPAAPVVVRSACSCVLCARTHARRDDASLAAVGVWCVRLAAGQCVLAPRAGSKCSRRRVFT
jgi:hypothetical protein